MPKLKIIKNIQDLGKKIFRAVKRPFSAACRVAKKEFSYRKGKVHLAFKPISLIVMGLVVVLFSVGIASFFTMHYKAKQSLVIKSFVSKQVASISVGQPVKWSILLKRSDITSGKYLLELPKGAKNVKIQTASAQQIEKILAAKLQPQLSLQQRQQLAVSMDKPKPFFATITASLYADLENAVIEVVQTVIGNFQELDVVNTADSTVVNLSDQAPATETPAETSTPSETIPPAESVPAPEIPTEITAPTEETPAPTACVSDSDCSSGQTCINSLCTVPSTETPSPTMCVSDSDCVTGQTCISGLCAAALSETPEATPEVPTTPSETPAETPAPVENTPAAETTTSVADEYVKVDYETPAPEITTQTTDTGKQVTVSAVNEDPSTPLVDVLAFTKIPELFKVGQEDKIKIKWKNNGNQNVIFHAYDTDGNGKLDYVEWTVDHLSDQVFDIIFISKAFRLDENKQIAEDIYDIVATQDGQWVTITNNQWLRFTFDAPVDSTKNIDIYAKPTYAGQPATIEIYPIYTDQDGNQTDGPLVATLDIGHEDYYHASMANLGNNPTDLFDFKIIGNVDIDYVQDAGGGTAIYWVGNGSNTSWNNTANWSTISGGGGGTAVPSGTNVATFDGGGTGDCNIDANVSAGAINIISGYTGVVTQTSTFTITVGGATGITLNSSTATLTLINSNNISSNVFARAGTMNINSAGALGSPKFSLWGGTINNTSGGAITITNVVDFNGDFTFGGTNDLNFSTGAVNLGPPSITVTTNGSAKLTFGGIISDSGMGHSLIKAGTGTLVLGGANTFTGGVTLNAGTLGINNATAIGTGALTIAGGTIDNTSGGAITLSSNNTQSWNGDFAFGGTNDLNLGTGAVTVGANITVTTNSSANLTVGAVSGASYTFTKAGTGTLTLGGNSSASALTVSAGTLAVGTYNLAITGASTVTGGTLTIGASSGTGWTTTNLTIGAGGIVTSSGLSKVTISGNYDQSSVTSKFLASTSVITVNGNGSFVVDGTLASTEYNNATLVLNGNNTLTYNNNSNYAANGFNNIVTGQGGNTTTVASFMALQTVTVGSGTLTGAGWLYLLGATPIVVDTANSIISVGSLKFFGTNQTIPSLAHGYSVSVALQGGTYTTTVTQTGDVTFNAPYNLNVFFQANQPQKVDTWITDGYNLTVGGNLTIGSGLDTGLKTLNATHNGARTSTITVTGNWWNYGNGTAPSRFIADNSTVILNRTSAGGTITSGATNSPFNILTISGAGGTYTLQDPLVTTGTLTLTAGTFAGGTQTITNTGFLMNGGTFTGSGAMTVNGNLTYTSGTNSHTGVWTQGTGILGWQTYGSRIRSYAVAAGATATISSPTFAYVGAITVPSTASVVLNYPIVSYPPSNNTVSLDGTWSGSSYFWLNPGNDFSNSGPIKIGNQEFRIYADNDTHPYVQSGDVQASIVRVVANTAGQRGRMQISGNLTASDVILGDFNATSKAGALDLLSGTHTITSIAQGNAANSGDAVSFGTSTVNVSGNLDFTGVAVTPGTSTVILNGTGAQTITSAGGLFSTLTVTNASVAGVTFADRLQAATLNDMTDGSTLKFAAASSGSPHTISSTMNIYGGASKITLAPSVAATTWYITAPAPTTATSVIVSYSSSTNHITPVTSTDGGNNVNWDFNTAPNVPTLVSPASASYTSDNTPTLSANYSDADTGDIGITNYRISSSGLVDCTNNTNVVAWGTSSATTTNNESTTWTNGSSIGSDATYYWCAQNDDGILQSAWTQMGTFILDTTNPTSTISTPSDNSYFSSSVVALTGTSSDTNLSTTTISVDGGAFTATGGSAASWTYSAGLAAGAHTFQTKATDLAGNTGLSTTIHVTVDTTNPTSTISTPADNSYSGSTTVALTGTSSDTNLSTTTISIDGGAFIATGGSAASWTYSATGLTEGAHTFQTKATDLAGRSGLSSTIHVTVDTTAPFITVNAFPTINISNKTSVDFSGECEGSFAITLSVSDTHSNTVTASPAPTCHLLRPNHIWSQSLDLSSLTDGDTITATASQTDAAGNTGTGTETSTKDTVAPIVGITQPSDNSYSGSTTVALTGTSADTNLSTTTISVDGGAFTATGGTAASWTYSATGLSQGSHTFQTQATDSAGNTGLSTVVHVTVDTTAPAAGSITYANGYLTSASVPITYSTGTDSVSGLNNSTGKIQRASATLSGGSCGSFSSFSDLHTGYNDSPYIDATVVTGNCYEYQYLISDNTTNQATYTSNNVVKIDTIAPETLTITFPLAAAKYNASTWAATPFSWTCADSVSGCDASTCEVYDNLRNDLGACLNFTLSSDNDYTIRIKERDNAGNQATSSLISFTYDTTAPSSVSSNADGLWHNSAFDVTLNCSDATSGCSKVYYCTNVYGDASCTPDTTYVTPGSTFHFATQGDFILRLKGVDFSGNETAAADQANHLKLDTTAPIITVSNPDTTAAQSKTITASTDSGTLTMSNTTGSVCDETLTFDDYASQTFSLESSNGKKVCYRAVDQANNTTYRMSNAIAGIDRTLPIVSGFNPASDSNIADATPTITFVLSETGDCFAATTDWGYDEMVSNGAVDCTESGLNMTCQMPDLGVDGTKHIYISCEDYPAANKDILTNNTELTYKLDTVFPVTTATATAGGSPYTFGDWTKSSVAVTLTCDDGSGTNCDKTYYCTDTDNSCTPATVYLGPVPISTESTSYIKFYSTDTVGNSEVVGVNNSKIIKIDVNPPVASDDIADQWHTSSIDVTFTCADNSQSGCSKVYYCTDINNLCTPSADYVDVTSNWKISFNTEGSYYLRYYAEDVAGNSEAVKTAQYQLKKDTTAPTNAGIASVTADLAGQLTITGQTAVDAGVGVSDTPYWFAETTGNPGAISSSTWQSSEVFVNTGLMPNTQYGYQGKAKDVLNNISDYSAILTKYTLANVPTSLTLTPDSAAQITATWNANSNPVGTQYYIENTTNSTNSGWITNNSWPSSGLTCHTAYDFSIKARNGESVVTAAVMASATTFACPSVSTGGGGGIYLGPTVPAGGFSLLINKGAVQTDSQDVVLYLKSGADGYNMSVSNDPNFTNAIQEPYRLEKQWRLTNNGGTKTVYVRFFNYFGFATNTVSATIVYNPKQTPIQQIIQAPVKVVQQVAQTLISIPNIINQILHPVTLPIPPALLQAPIPPQPLVTQTVTQKTPTSMTGTWDLLPTGVLPSLVSGPASKDLISLASKLPGLNATLNQLGVSKTTDINKLIGVQLTSPGLTEISGINPTNIVTQGLPAAPASVALSEMTPAAKAKIPTNVLFVRTRDGLIDQTVNLSVNQSGSVQRSVNTIAGESLQLIIKPDKPAKAIRGYLLFSQTGSTNNTIATDVASGNFGKRLVLQTFDYTDSDNDGIWTADIVSPVVDGNYEIVSVTEYQDVKLLPSQISLVTVVDPEGYIYFQTAAGETRIKNAKVSIFWLNPANNKMELWNAKKYQQVNPQITNNTGKYTFLVPEGTYYITVSAPGYKNYKSANFDVYVGEGVHTNIKLEPNSWLTRLFTWSF